jgi:hypothetical protein
MPNVPYQPVPNVQPLPGTGTQGVSINTPGAAFGETVAGALKSVGSNIASGGDELFARAEAMQNLTNHNDATMAAADFADAAGDLHQQLKSLEGRNAVSRMDTFPQELEAKRMAIREGLKTDVAKKSFDAESRNVYNRTVLSGADWAAQQHRVSTDQADDAAIASHQRQAGLNTNDEAMVKQNLDQLEALVRAKGAAKGWEDTKTDYEVFAAKSGALANSLVELMKNKPFDAAERLGKLNNQLTDDDRNKVTNLVFQQRRTTGNRMIVADLRSGRDTSIGDRIVGPEQSKMAIGGFESGNRYGLTGTETKHGVALGRYQVMSEFLPGFLKEAGMPPMSSQEFLANPKAQDQLFQTVFGGYQDKYGSFNEAASHWFTGTSIANARAEGRFDANGTTVDRYLTNTNAILGRTASERDLMAAAEKRGDALVPSSQDPLFQVYLQQEVQRQSVSDRRLEQEKKIQDINTVLTGLNTLGSNGEYITSPDQLFANPQTKASFDAMDEKDKQTAMKQLTANITKGYPVTAENTNLTRQLYGMLSTQEGKETFATTNLLDKKLTNSQYDMLHKKQVSMQGQAGDDPRITGLLRDGEVQAKLDSLGISHSKDPDSYFQLIGGLQQTLDAVQTQQQVPLNRKEMKEIFNDLVKQEVTKSFFNRIFGGTSFSEPFFKQAPQNDSEQRMWDELAKDPRFQASDAATQQNLFAAVRYNRIRNEREQKQQALK